MNIFVVDHRPHVAARNLCDKHVVKMIVESTQMLINPFIFAGIPLNAKTQAGSDYKLSHLNHPCSVWARASYMNYAWLLEHALELCGEYTKRYGKAHYCQTVLVELAKKIHLLDFDNFDRTPFALAMPDQYKSDNAVESYRAYYRGEKAAMAKWNKMPFRKPTWF
jgi:hypothetical protein